MWLAASYVLKISGRIVNLECLHVSYRWRIYSGVALLLFSNILLGMMMYAPSFHGEKSETYLFRLNLAAFLIC